MATIKVEVTYDPKKETLSQALASLLTEKPEHTEITAQMSLFDNPAPTETPTAQASTEAPQESPAESAPETPDTKPAEEKTISKADVRALAVKLSKNDKAALKAIFKELGVANLSAVKEEDYPVFYEKLVAARASWVEQLSSFATQVTDRTGYKFARSFYVNSEVNVERPEDADTVEYFFIVETYYITLMTKDAPTTLTPEEEAKKREEQMNQERKNAAEKALSEATARAYELRADFVATVSAAAIKKRLVDIVALWAYAEYWDDTSWLTEEEIAQATGAETLAEDDEGGEGDAAFTLQAVTDAIGKTPEKTLLRMIYARLGDGKSEGYFRSYWNSYIMKHEENEKLDRIYALLIKLGYEMSDDEKALQDGTHELFGEATDE